MEHIKYIHPEYPRYNLYFADESRFGLFTRHRRVLTIRGCKPVCPYQHRFENTYLFGAFSPLSGSSIVLDLPFCNTATFQIFINELSALDKEEFKIVVLDNGAFHKSKSLKIPSNMAFLFLPPYSPELNPAEKVWWTIKGETSMQAFATMEDLQKALDKSLQLLTVNKIKQLTGYKIYLHNFKTVFN